MPQLPLFILCHIALNIGLYQQILAIPLFARWTQKNQIWLQKKFTKLVFIDNCLLYILAAKNKDIIYLDDNIKKYLHRSEGPAMISTNGDKYWFRYGKLHRQGGPAVIIAKRKYELYCEEIYMCSDEYWVKHGINRINSNKKTKLWYKNGILHRKNGPAVEWKNGDKEWWINGKRCKPKHEE